MFYKYDFAGWYAGSTDQELDRTTDVKPTNLTVTEVEGEMRSNFTGYEWIEMPYVHSEAPAPAGNVWDAYIDIGPFFDRFGAQKIPVLSSTDATVQAILRDVQVRKWLDLNRPDVAQSLAFIGTKVAGLTPALQSAIITTPVTPEENMALRKTYFS